jgi:hypothetical protein
VFTEQRMHLARVSKMALDAGVAERLVSLAEAQADLFNTAITNIVTDLGMDPADGNVRSIVAHRLSEMAALAAG